MNLFGFWEISLKPIFQSSEGIVIDGETAKDQSFELFETRTKKIPQKRGKYKVISDNSTNFTSPKYQGYD